MIEGKIIAWDIDDVLADNASGFAAFCNKTWGLSMMPEDFSEDWCAMWGVDIDEVNRRSHIFHTSDAALHYRPHNGALQVIAALGEKNDNRIVTSRRQLLRTHTQSWVDKHFPELFNGVHYSGIFDTLQHGDHLKTKVDVLKEINADILVDDQLKHCIAAARAGIPAILFGNYRWNQAEILPQGITRCETMQEIGEYFGVAS